MAHRYGSPSVGEHIVAKGLAGRGRNLNRFGASLHHDEFGSGHFRGVLETAEDVGSKKLRRVVIVRTR
jgi:hypothetical protein